MLKTKEEILNIISNKDSTEKDKIDIIVKYIYDKKNIDLSEQQINLPQHQVQEMLLYVMFKVAKNYYLNESN